MRQAIPVREVCAADMTITSPLGGPYLERRPGITVSYTFAEKRRQAFLEIKVSFDPNASHSEQRLMDQLGATSMQYPMQPERTLFSGLGGLDQAARFGGEAELLHMAIRWRSYVATANCQLRVDRSQPPRRVVAEHPNAFRRRAEGWLRLTMNNLIAGSANGRAMVKPTAYVESKALAARGWKVQEIESEATLELRKAGHLVRILLVADGFFYDGKIVRAKTPALRLGDRWMIPNEIAERCR